MGCAPSQPGENAQAVTGVRTHEHAAGRQHPGTPVDEELSPAALAQFPEGCILNLEGGIVTGVKKVVVVGAGISGLAAAGSLHRAGAEVVVLEGRDRIGGRLYTDENGLDIGGHWIHGGGPDPAYPIENPANCNPVRALCDELGIKTTLTDGDSTYIGDGETRSISFYGEDYKPLTEVEINDLWDVYEVFFDKLHAREEKQREEGSNGEGQPLSSAIEAIYNEMPDLTDQQRMYINWHCETEFGGDYGEDPEYLSFFHYDGGSEGHYLNFDGGDRVLEGGYTSLVQKLTETIPGNAIQLNKTVTEVKQDESGVQVLCQDGSMHSGDALLVTLPLGILQRGPAESGHVAFTPPLPEAKQGAISRMRMGCLNKLFLVFDKCYWPNDQYSFAYINRTRDEKASMVVNLWPSHGVPILCILMGGTAGRAMGNSTQEVNVAWAMPHLRNMFGDADMPDPLKVVQTDWANDPFSYGAYSCAAATMRPDDQRVLGDPVGKVYFAGEATSVNFWGCVHGAILTGLREARRITGDDSIMTKASLASTKRAHKKQILLRNFMRFLAGNGTDKLKQVYDALNVDGKGEIDAGDLLAVFQRLRTNATKEDVQVIISAIDKNKDGAISYDELLLALRGHSGISGNRVQHDLKAVNVES